MSDARDKLQAAIEANKKAGPAPKPALKAPPAKKDAPPPVSNRSSASAAPPKPEKSKSSFLKKKKKPKAKPSAKKGGGGGFLSDKFGKLAKTFVDELKEATSEISPGQLLTSAKDGISSLGIGKGDGGEKSKHEAGGKSAAPTASSQGSEESPAAATAPSANDAAGSPAKAEPEAPKEFSTVKVQKAPPARRKKKSGAAATDAELVAAEEPVLASDDPVEQPGAGADAKNEAAVPVEAAEDAASTAADPEDGEATPTSPTKVEKAAKQKSDEPEPVAPEPEEPLSIEQEDASPSAETESTVSEEEPDKAESDEPESAEPQQAAEPPAGERPAGSEKPKPKSAPKQNVQISKEEQLVRAFHSLHKILNSELWNPIATAANSKPSSIFAPRQLFDEQWATPEFKDGLKAASRLASGFTFDPAAIEFDQTAIEAVKTYALDPQNMIKPHTELLTKAIGSKQTEEVLELVKKGKVRKLLYSVGTRMGTFIPTIEILARIYIGLRRKEDIIPGDRLMIQEEVLMKYNKSPYTEDMGKKARNLSLNYFVDYLTEYGFKLYKDRMDKAPEGQNHFSAQKRRHGTIRDSCVNLVKEWGTKVGVSTPAMMNLEGRLMEMADAHLAALTGEVPNEE